MTTKQSPSSPPIEIYKCSCKYCQAGLSYVIGTFKQTVRCGCGQPCSHWGYPKEEVKHIHIHHKLIKYLKWLYIQQRNNDEQGFYSALALYREILKTSYINAIKISSSIENITNYLVKQFNIDDVKKYCDKNDSSFLENALKQFLSQKVKLFGFPVDADIGAFVEVLKPIIYPYVQFTQILRILELKKPNVYRYIISDSKKLWWLKQCIQKLNDFIRFEPPELMLTIDEVFGTTFKEREPNE